MPECLDVADLMTNVPSFELGMNLTTCFKMEMWRSDTVETNEPYFPRFKAFALLKNLAKVKIYVLR